MQKKNTFLTDAFDTNTYEGFGFRILNSSNCMRMNFEPLDYHILSSLVQNYFIEKIASDYKNGDIILINRQLWKTIWDSMPEITRKRP